MVLVPEDLRKYSVGQWASRSGDSEPLANPRRDSTALTVVEVDLAELATLRAPVYRVVDRCTWVGVEYATLHGQLVSLAEAWGARVLVIDATGVGAGLASSLQRALPGKVIPYRFNKATKSKLGWGFLSVIETGRYKEARVESRESGDVYDSRFSDLASLFLRQCRACQMEILPGPERRMKWGVPNGMRDPDTGDYLHDDLVLSAALCAALDECSANEWAVSGAPVIIKRQDPLAEMDEEGF